MGCISNENTNFNNYKIKISEIVKEIIKSDKENKFLINKYFCYKIDNHELFKGVNIEKLNKEELNIPLFVFAIDTKYSSFLDSLISSDIIKKK